MKKRHTALVTAALLVILCLYTHIKTGSNGDDPEWPKTHISVDSVGSAIDMFGDDLHLDALLHTERKIRHTFFELEFDENGSADNKESYIFLYGSVRYTDFPHNRLLADDDSISIEIYFDPDVNVYVPDRKYHFETFENAAIKTKTINGTEVRYIEFSSSNNKFKYSNVISFEHYEKLYFLTSRFKTDPIIIWDIVNDILGH